MQFFTQYRFQAALALLVLLSGWTVGYGMARSVYQTQISRLKAEFAAKELTWQKQQNSELFSSLKRLEQGRKAAEKINQTQIEHSRAAIAHADELKRKIDDVIQQDQNIGNDCTGLGAFGLQHYRQSLGYE